MARPHTSVETENRTAFLVQLQAVLTQIGAVVDSTSASNKTKLADIATEVKEWLDAIGSVGGPKPSLVQTVTTVAQPAASPTEAAPVGTTEATPDCSGVAEGEAPLFTPTETAVSSLPEDVKSPSSAALAAPVVAESSLQSHSFTADVVAANVRGDLDDTESACEFGSKCVIQLVDLLRLLFATGIPESVKLRGMGRALTRLITVRCTSAITAALQHVVFQTYSGSSTDTEEQVCSDKEMRRRVAVCVVLAHDLTLSTKALAACISLVTFNADFSIPAAVRFPLQLCVNIVKQLRRTMLLFQSNISREERALLRAHLTAATGIPAVPNASTTSFSSREQQSEATKSESQKIEAYVQARVKALEVLWGPSLTRSLANIGSVILPAVTFMVSVAAVKELGSLAELVQLKNEAQHDLFALCDVTTVRATVASTSSAAGGIETAVKLPSRGPSMDDLDRKADDVISTPNDPTDVSHSFGALSTTLLADTRVAAAAIVQKIGISYGSDYVTAVAAWAGDESEGRLVATRIVSDVLRTLAITDPRALKRLVDTNKWRKTLLSGILNCLVSMHPAVLASGLEDLYLIVTLCYDVLGQEVGFLYCGCVLRLLESDNCPGYVKKEIVLHLVNTLLKVPKSASGERGVPLLLRLYRIYDLNVHAHQLNLIQQLVAALSKIVRRAAPAEFTQHQQQLQPQQPADGSGNRRLSNSELLAQGLTLPSLALHGLVLVIELLSAQSPLEDDSGKNTERSTAQIANREHKLEEQRLVDLFNSSPKKGITRTFGVTEEEMAPPGTHEFARNWELEKLPKPATEETHQRIEAVVDFFMAVNSLNPDAVAEYITTPAVFPLQVCMCYMRRLRLAGCDVVQALMELLSLVPLPKEGQRIERLLEYFSGAYFEANNVPGVDKRVFPFTRPDTCFIVIVATVMLNTDLHNPLSGSRMNQKTFRSQLKGCDKAITDQFADDIFYTISRNSLGNARGLSSIHSATVAETHGGFEALFISGEERRHLAFGLERQKLVSETRLLLQCRNNGEPVPPDATDAWWCAAGRDLFLSTWASVCAVFGPAMCETPVAPVEALLQCIRGLQALMCAAASFGLSTECEVTLLALLRMCDNGAVRSNCRTAILAVASTAYSLHFSARCWLLVFTLMAQIRREGGGALMSQVECVLARVEVFTRSSCEVPLPSGQQLEQENISARATARILSGIADMLKGLPENDGLGLSTGLYFMKRALEYSLITHSPTASGVSNFVNVRDFSRQVLPLLTSLVTQHRNSDEGLQVLMEFSVDVLTTMWCSYSAKRRQAQKQSLSASSSGPTAPAAYVATLDCSPPEFVDCYDFFRLCYATNLQATLVKIHLLQAVKELMTRTLRFVPLATEANTTDLNTAASSSSATGAEGGDGHLALYTLFSAWRRVLFPLTRALSDRDAAGTEVSSLGVLVLRNLVVVCCNTDITSVHAVPARVRSAALVLLANAAYIGGMCSDVDSAQACLGQLTTICSTALSQEGAASALGAPRLADSSVMSRSEVKGGGVVAPGLVSRNSGGDGSLAVTDGAAGNAAAALPRTQSDKLIHHVIECMSRQPFFVVAHALERLCLLLRCERDMTRAEAVESLRTLSLQMQAQQVPPLASQLCDVVLEGTLRRPSAHGEVPLSDPSLISFWLFLMNVPPTMKRCSRSAFRSALPGILSFMVGELLSAAAPANLVRVARLVMERCLVPIVVSPNCIAFQTRTLAARALTQCYSHCLSRYSQGNGVGNAESDAATLNEGTVRLVASVLDCIGVILYSCRIPRACVVPRGAEYTGKHWVADSKKTTPGMMETDAERRQKDKYAASATAALGALATLDPHDIIGSGRSTLFSSSSSFSTGDSAAGPLTATRTDREAALGDQQQQGVRRANGTVDTSAAAGPVGDDQLLEYCTLLAQIVSGLPRVLSSAMTSAQWDLQTSEAAPRTKNSSSGWEPPRVAVFTLLQLLSDAASTLFAALWRINNPLEIEGYFAQCIPKGREAPAVSKNNALLPHAAIRGTLNSYMELAIRTEEYPVERILRVVVDVLEGISVAQAISLQGAVAPGKSLSGAGTAAHITAGVPNGHSTASSGIANGVTVAGAGTDIADAVALHRLSPQAQQHIRTCNSGMVQELSVVLASWVRSFTHPPASLSCIRHTQLEAMALDPQIFSALVQLLSPTAGSLIVTARDYFGWFIARKQIRAGGSETAVTSSSSVGRAASVTSTPTVTPPVSLHPEVDAAAVGVASPQEVSSTQGEPLLHVENRKPHDELVAASSAAIPEKRYGGEGDVDYIAEGRLRNGVAALLQQDEIPTDVIGENAEEL